MNSRNNSFIVKLWIRQPVCPLPRGCSCCQSHHVPPDGPPGPTSSRPTGANRVSNVRSNASLVTGVESGGRLRRTYSCSFGPRRLDCRVLNRASLRPSDVIVCHEVASPVSKLKLSFYKILESNEMLMISAFQALHA